MANNLTKSGITSNGTIEAWHVTQSIDAFTGTEAYNINLSGSLAVTGSLQVGSGSISSGSYQTVIGSFNNHNDITSRFIVGNGTSNSSRSDAFKVTHSSSIYIPTQSSAPAWTGLDGEIVPAVVSGSTYLYMWSSGSWKSTNFTPPYGSYISAVNQDAAENALTVLVYDNTLGRTLTSTKQSTGNYYLSAINAFPTRDKVWIALGGATNGTYHPISTGSSLLGYYYVGRASADDIEILTFNSSFVATDLYDLIGAVRRLILPEIRVYK